MTYKHLIKHYSELQQPAKAGYPGSDETFSLNSRFGTAFDFQNLGIHHEVLPPGARTSWPHAESDEEEFVYVIEGHPQAWIQGEIYDLKPGDGVGFKSGTGINHTFLNNTNEPVRLLVVGERKKDSKTCYPFHPQRKEHIKENYWHDAPQLPMGPHAGMPDKKQRS